MSGYMQGTRNAIAQGIEAYANHVERLDERAHRRERERVADERWAMDEMRTRESHEMAKERHGWARETHDRQKHEWQEQEQQEDILARSIEMLNVAKPGEHIELPISPTALTTARGTGPSNDDGRAVRTVAVKGDGDEVVIGIEREKEDGTRTVGFLNQGDPNDPNGQPWILTPQEVADGTAHLLGVKRGMMERGFSEEEADHAAVLSVADDGDGLRPASESEWMENLKRNLFGNTMERLRDGGVGAVAKDQLGPGVGLMAQASGAQAKAVAGVAREFVSGAAGGAGLLVGGEKTRASWEQTTRKLLGGGSIPKNSAGEELVSGDGKVRVSKITGPDDLAALAQLGEKERAAGITPVVTASASDTRRAQDSGYVDIRIPKHKRQQLAADFARNGGNAEAGLNFMETGDWRFNAHQLETQKAQLAASWRTAKGKDNSKTPEDLLENLYKNVDGVAADVARIEAGPKGDASRVKFLEAKIRDSLHPYLASSGLLPRFSSDPVFKTTISRGLKNALAFSRESNYEGLQVGPAIATEIGKLQPTSGAETIQRAQQDVSETIQAVSASRGVDVNQLSTLWIRSADALMRAHGRDYLTAQEHSALLLSLKEGDLGVWLQSIEQLEAQNEADEGDDA